MIINDSNYHLVLGDERTKGLCGCRPRKSTFGSLPFAAVDTTPLIPWEEMPDRISDQERNKSSLEHIFLDCGVKIKNQGSLNYCWAFSGVTSLEVVRAKRGLPYRDLSPSSVAGPIVQFQNIGWYPEDCLKGMADTGAATTAFVPQTTNNPRDFKPGWRDSAAQNKVTRWLDVDTRNLQLIFTNLLLNRPVPVGLGWWSHAICFLRLLDRYPSSRPDNPYRYGIKFPNSWDTWWGDKGWGTVEQSRMIPDQAYAPDDATFTE